MAKKTISVLIVCIILLSVLCSFSGRAYAENADLDDYAGKRIGVLVGTMSDEVAEQHIESPQIQYFNTSSDIAVALDKGKIDAYVTDQPVWRITNMDYPDQVCAYRFSDDSYGFIFQKDNEKTAKICSQLNEFLDMCESTGMLKKIEEIWFGSDESVKTVDMSGLSGENGVLSFSTTTDTGAPFSYVKDNKVVGYDVDIAVRFCREYGYGIDIRLSTFSGMMADVSSGKSDFGASCITITEERKESMLFSRPDYVGGIVMVVKSAGNLDDDTTASLDRFAKKKVAVQTGTVFDQVATEYIPECKVEYFNSGYDLAIALDAGKVSAYIADEPFARTMISQYPSHRILEVLEKEDYALALPKDNPGTEKLCGQFNDFLKKCREDGTMDELLSTWIDNDSSTQRVDLSALTGENGTITMAVCSYAAAPFVSIRDNEYIGYDIDFAQRFCKEYGYGLKIVDYDASGLFACLSGGKCDFGATCIAVTEERKETMVFTDTYYVGGAAIVIKDGSAGAEISGGDENDGFFSSIKNSFNKTFIRENRYKLFLSGILTTLIIVVLSILFGSALGFLLYFGYYNRGWAFRGITNVFSKITENTPVVVILMILYYVVFGSVEINGMWVSVIGFTLIFAATVMGLVKVGVNAVDPGQREAALALGYTENSALFRVVLPQAARHFLPGYKSAIVQLIKGTAVVGYIAVQDLTTVSDIVRSRTYEAFFPLIASAVLYFAIAVLVTAVINRIEIRIDPHLRKKEKIMKGVDLK